MSVIRMLATDLDGTLIGSANDFPLYDVFRDRVDKLRVTDNTIWVACTGRSLSSFRDFFSPMCVMGLMPDYVVVNHAYIFSIRRHYYLPHVFWNLRIRYLIWASQLYVSEAIEEWYDMITGVSLGVSTIRKKKDRLCLRFDSDESATVAADLLRDKVKAYKQLRVFKYLQEVDVRTVPFTKGLAISELARHLGIQAREVMAIGNGLNDVSMMTDGVAGLTGCPGNSEDEVLEAVHKMGGHIASKRSLGGVIEILDAYRAGTICSDLPVGWAPSTQGRNPSPSRTSKTRNKKKTKVKSYWLFGLIAYVVLTVFANFRLIPYVSGFILIPYKIMLRLMQKIVFLIWS